MVGHFQYLEELFSLMVAGSKKLIVTLTSVKEIISPWYGPSSKIAIAIINSFAQILISSSRTKTSLSYVISQLTSDCSSMQATLAFTWSSSALLMASSRSSISARALNSSWEFISVLRFFNFSSNVSPLCLKRRQVLFTSVRVNLRNLISKFKALCSLFSSWAKFQCISSRASMSIVDHYAIFGNLQCTWSSYWQCTNFQHLDCLVLLKQDQPVVFQTLFALCSLNVLSALSKPWRPDFSTTQSKFQKKFSTFLVWFASGSFSILVDIFFCMSCRLSSSSTKPYWFPRCLCERGGVSEVILHVWLIWK